MLKLFGIIELLYCICYLCNIWKKKKLTLSIYPNQDTSLCNHFLFIRVPTWHFGLSIDLTFRYAVPVVKPRQCRIWLMDILVEFLFLIIPVQEYTTAKKKESHYWNIICLWDDSWDILLFEYMIKFLKRKSKLFDFNYFFFYDFIT